MSRDVAKKSAGYSGCRLPGQRQVQAWRGCDRTQPEYERTTEPESAVLPGDVRARGDPRRARRIERDLGMQLGADAQLIGHAHVRTGARPQLAVPAAEIEIAD